MGIKNVLKEDRVVKGPEKLMIQGEGKKKTGSLERTGTMVEQENILRQNLSRKKRCKNF